MNDLFAELATIGAAFQARMDYAKTLALLRAMKAGAVSLENVTLTADGWSVAAIAPDAPHIAEEVADSA